MLNNKNVTKASVIIRDESGVALFIVSALVLLISLFAWGTLNHFDAVNTLQRGEINQDQAFYVVEGIRGLAQNVMQQYFQGTNTPSIVSLTTALNTQLPPLVPSGYTVSPVTVTGDLSPLNPIPAGPVVLPKIQSGPFMGIPSQQADAFLQIKVLSSSNPFAGLIPASTYPVGEIDLTIHLSKLSPLQFFHFWDQTFRDESWENPSNATLTLPGRVHANGDLCLGLPPAGGSNYFIFNGITAAGRLMHQGDPRCKYSYGGYNNFTEAANASGTIIAPMNGRGDTNGCTNCKNSGQDWKVFAVTHYNYSVFDREQGVPHLQLAESVAATTQPGLDGDPNSATDSSTSNNGDLRFLVDPVIPTDTAAVKQKKFSYQADIRVIDGVWYLRDETNPDLWPGVAVWSDHPGRVDDAWGNPVGQQDIKDYWATTLWPWGMAIPSGFSPYGYDNAAQSLSASLTGAITYGYTYGQGWTVPNSVGIGLQHGYCGMPTNPRPGFDSWCPLPGGAAGYDYSYFTGPGCMLDSASNVLNCNYMPIAALWPPTVVALSAQVKKLLATRQGTYDFNVAGGSAGGAAIEAQRAAMLPVNFSVADFAAALANPAPGELGSYFGVGKFHPDPFNGIVFITSTWPGSDQGYGAASAPTASLEWPFQGSATDPTQIPARNMGIYGKEQQALPFPLCSNASGAPRPGYAGQPFETQTILGTPVTRFKVPDCSQYSRAGIAAYPDLIRITNAYDLSAFASTGLSIVSNIPVMVNSGFNTLGGAGGNGIPALVAGDAVTLASDCIAQKGFNNFTWWCNDTGSQHWNMAVLAGWSANGSSTSSDNAPGVNNNFAEWRGNILDFDGAMTFGFYPVFYRSNHIRGLMTSPTHMKFDTRFNDPTQLPPGMPSYTVYTVNQWQRK